MRKLRDPEFQQILFRRVNVMMLLMWRLGLGRVINAAPAITGRVMIIGTTGRRSGHIRRFPITYAPADGHVYCLAGFGTRTDWYRNALEHREVELWLPDGYWRGTVEPLRADQDLDAVRDVFKASAFASRAFEGIDASTVGDDQLRAMADRFPLVRITLTERAQGSRYADLLWVWPMTAALIVLSHSGRVRHRPRGSPG